jgi:hypothetical protein
MEDKLSGTRALPADIEELSKMVKEQANLMIESELESPVAAAGFMVLVCSYKLDELVRFLHNF